MRRIENGNKAGVEGQSYRFKYDSDGREDSHCRSKGEYTMTQTIDGYEFSQLGKKLFALSDVEVGTSIQNKKLNVDGDFP
jgi:hypothetical protein